MTKLKNESMVSGDITNPSSGETTGAIVHTTADVTKKKKTPLKRYIERSKHETNDRSSDDT